MGFLIVVPGAAVFELYANGAFEAQGAFPACGLFVAEGAVKVAPVEQEQKIVA